MPRAGDEGGQGPCPTTREKKPRPGAAAICRQPPPKTSLRGFRAMVRRKIRICRARTRGGAAPRAGASSGLGLAIGGAFLEQGMRVAVHYRSNRTVAEELCARFPGLAVPVDADLGTEEGCARAVRRSVEVLGGLGQLVHSAGMWNEGPIATISGARRGDLPGQHVQRPVPRAGGAAAPREESGAGRTARMPLCTSRARHRRTSSGRIICVSGGALHVLPRGQFRPRR